MNRKLQIILITSLLLVSCERISFLSFKDKDELLAKVGDKELYFADLDMTSFAGLPPEDSLALLKVHIEKWVKIQLKIAELSESMSDKEIKEIERKIEDYRNSLMVSNFDRALAASVDTVVTKAEITEYYQQNKDNYRLIGPIVTARIISYPKDFRQEKKLKELMNSSTDDALYDLKDIVKKGNFKFEDLTDKWYYFKDILQHIPFSNKKFDEFLMKNNSLEVADGNTKYIMTIKSYRLTGEYIPVEMVEKSIKAAIINAKRKDYIREIEDTLYNRSIQSGITSINVKDSIYMEPMKIEETTEENITE